VPSYLAASRNSGSGGPLLADMPCTPYLMAGHAPRRVRGLLLPDAAVFPAAAAAACCVRPALEPCNDVGVFAFSSLAPPSHASQDSFLSCGLHSL